LLTLVTARSVCGKLELTAAGEIDLSSVRCLDSAAVNVLFPYAEYIRVIAHRFLARIFDISGFSE
jgi:ABC-type transporter Mla MlaB component